MFYENDLSTTLADINGTGPKTLGDWVKGTNYPIINGSKALNTAIYAPLGYPTVNVICPKDKKIVYDLYDDKISGGGLAAMEATIMKYISSCKTSASIEEDNLPAFYLNIFPSPVESNATLQVSSNHSEMVQVEIYNSMGQLINSKQTPLIAGENTISLSVEDYVTGNYFIKVTGQSGFSKVVSFLKH